MVGTQLKWHFSANFAKANSNYFFFFIQPQFGFPFPSALLLPETLKFEVSEIDHVLLTILYEMSKF